MDWRRMFEPQGLNWWIVVSGMGMNFVLTSFLMIGVTYASTQNVGALVATGVMSVGGFVIPLFTAYVCGRIGEDRYTAYAFYPLVGYLILTVPAVLSTGVFGLLMILFGVLGAFNGSQLAIRSAMKRREKIFHDLDIDSK